MLPNLQFAIFIIGFATIYKIDLQNLPLAFCLCVPDVGNLNSAT